MIPYRTVEDCFKETEIKRSRFIAFVRRVRSEDEVFAELSTLRKRYFDATHVCYAAVFDKLGNAARFSDDGEPGGTAGQPILEAIKGAGLVETLVAVVRYFGGVKLGAGGLVRAYSSSASSALAEATKIECVPSDVYTLTTDFGRAKRFAGIAERSGITVESTDYGESVTFTLSVPLGFDMRQAVADILKEEPMLVRLESRYVEREAGQ